MIETLVLCPDCSRHVRASETACPFCRASRVAPLARLALVAAAALAAAPVAAQGLSPRETTGPGMQGYGAPPVPRDMLGLPAQPSAPAPLRMEARVETVTVARGGARVAESLRRVLAARTAMLTGCLGTQGMGARVTVQLRFDVTPRGAAAGLRAASPEAPDVARCIEQRLQRALTLSPPPRGPAAQEVDATVVLRLVGVTPSSPPRAVVGAPAPGRCGPSPAGCHVGGTGCGPGMVCQRASGCRPSSCGCNPETGAWMCTSDCGGGVCVPASRASE